MAWRLIHQLHVYTCRALLKEEFPCNFRYFSTTAMAKIKQREINQAVLIKDQYFEQETRNKETFLELVEVYKMKEFRTGHIEFIYAALNRMEEYGVAEDLECYKQIIDVMPKGKMVSTNSWLADYHYYPKHQDCIIDVLSKMESNRVMPDRDMFHQLMGIFGKKSSPGIKLMRMLYWLPKMKYASPWPVPESMPEDEVEVVVLALKRMCSVDLENEVTVFHTKDDELSAEDTWIVNSQSPVQKTLLKYHPKNMPIFVEGPFKMYFGRKNVVDYFILRADMPKNRRRKKFRDPDEISNLKIPFFDPPTSDDLIPDFSEHEQKDGVIYALASVASLSNESLQSWVRLLQKNGNSSLEHIPVIFRCNFTPPAEDQLAIPSENSSDEKKENG